MVELTLLLKEWRNEFDEVKQKWRHIKNISDDLVQCCKGKLLDCPFHRKEAIKRWN